MVAAALILAQPYWLLLLPLLAVGGFVFWRVARRYAARRVGLFVSAGLLQEAVTSLSGWPRLARFAWPALVVGLLIVAAARPLYGPKPGSAERKGVDFVIALDVSKSMWAEDVAPNRLDAVKQELDAWLKTNAGDRMGLILFAGDAMIQAPVTADFQALARVLQSASPKSLSKGGTNISEAVAMAAKLLTKDDLDSRALVIISDGESLDGDAIAATKDARTRDNITTFTIGVGSEAGAKIPTADYAEFAKNPKRDRPYVRNEYGTEVVSRMDAQALQRIAAAGGGQYATFAPGGHFFAKFRDDALLPLARQRKILNVEDYHELYQIPLALAILLLMAEPFLPRTRARTTTHRPGVAVIAPSSPAEAAGAPVKFAKRAARPSVKALAFFLLLPVSGTMANNTTATLQQAGQLIKDRQAAEAAALLKTASDQQPDDLPLRYNYALALYQAGQFEEAIGVFQDVKLATEDEAFRERILFQLANAQFRLGRQLTNQSAAVLSLERSLAFYDELLAQGGSSEARANRQSAEKGLQEILRKIATDRAKAAEAAATKQQFALAARMQSEALDALEKLAAIDPKDKSLSEEISITKKHLAESLMKEAAKHIAETDKIEATNDKNRDREVLTRREQAIDLQKQALAQTPEDASIPPAIQEQQAKMSALMTKRAEEKILPYLAKEKLGGGELSELSKSRKDLTDALALDPSNTKAQELKARAEERLTKDLLAQADRELAHAKAPNETRNRLRAALTAQEAFQKVREIHPDSEPVAQGLADIEKLLPQLHSNVAELDLKEAKKLLQPKADATQPDQEAMKKAVGALETSTQNFNRALSMKPDEEKFQKSFSEAQQLLSESRDELDKQRNSQAAAADTETPPADSSETAAAPNAKPYSQAPNMSKSKGPSESTESFWNRAKRDW